jgi:hypothetical protein
VRKLYLLFISADAAKEKEKKVLLPAGVSKSAAHTVYIQYYRQPIIGTML